MDRNAADGGANPPVCATAEVLHNGMLSPQYGRVALVCPEAFETAEPGQFLMLGFPESADPLLRRPYSIHALSRLGGRATGVEILYKVVGPATRRLSGLRPGDAASILGPLGKGFRIPAGVRRLFLAAGGVGIAPFRLLLDRLEAAGRPAIDCRLFFGVRTAEELLCVRDIEARGIPVLCTTEDGSAGAHCRVTDPLSEAIDREPPDLVLACGPRPMLSCVAEITRRRRVPCQISLEERMACGMGACLGCAVPARGKGGPRFHHACVDGPVFDVEEIEL
ncbi:MAG: dihydroorotate dehydrogenase electron transfer subunit [Desulfobacterales bacterium]